MCEFDSQINKVMVKIGGVFTIWLDLCQFENVIWFFNHYHLIELEEFAAPLKIIKNRPFLTR